MARRLNKKRISIASIILILIIVLITMLINFLVTTIKSTVDHPSKITTTHKSEDPTVSFVAVGDNIIHERVYQYAHKNNTYDFTPCYQNIKDYIQDADLSFINQETIIGGESLKISGYPAFNSPTELAKNLVDTGFDLINGCTNHSFDRNIQGILEANKIWRSFDNIIYAGTYDNQEDRDNIRVIEKNGIKFALLCYTEAINEYDTNPYRQLEKYPYAIPLLSDKDAIANDVSRAKELADVIIVSAHWGDENVATISSEQQAYAQMFADLGVDLVIGTHPHIIQPVTWLTGVNGNKTFVAYSLGNFLSTMETKDTQLEGMLSLEFVKDDDKVTMKNLTWTPLINHFGDGTVEVYRLSSYPTTKLNNHFVLKNCPNVIEEFKNTTKTIINNQIKIKE